MAPSYFPEPSNAADLHVEKQGLEPIAIMLYVEGALVILLSVIWAGITVKNGTGGTSTDRDGEFARSLTTGVAIALGALGVVFGTLIIAAGRIIAFTKATAMSALESTRLLAVAVQPMTPPDV